MLLMAHQSLLCQCLNKNQVWTVVLSGQSNNVRQIKLVNSLAESLGTSALTQFCKKKTPNIGDKF